jgi:aspartokinase-like uncharacterized kinase
MEGIHELAGKSLAMPPYTIKVGGSLFDLPDLGRRLGQWLAGLAQGQVLLVPGGGPTADVVRLLDRRHHLGEERAHWLALRALSLNAHFLAALLPKSVVLTDLDGCPRAWQENRLAILDAFAFAQADEAQPAQLAHSWEVTSDSIAARAAQLVGTEQLILLKSVDLEHPRDWTQAVKAGVVDGQFPRIVKEANLNVRIVNFRRL